MRRSDIALLRDRAARARMILYDGRKSITLWAERLRACEDSGRWPGYTDSVVEMTRPAWIDETE